MLNFQRIKSVLRVLLNKRVKLISVPTPVFHGTLLQGRNALITGGGSGIGAAIAEAFLRNGANVVIAGRSFERLKVAQEKIMSSLSSKSNKGKLSILQLDICECHTFEDFVSKAVDLLEGEIDLLVNNAGVARGWQYSKVTEDEFSATLDTNLKGAYFLSQTVAKRMVEHKIQGNILNVSSASSLRPGVTPYILSKWAVRALTIGLAKILTPYNVVVNGLAPGPTATSMIVKDNYDGIESSTVPVGRLATPEEVANMAVVLTSTLGRMVVGDTLFLTGGAGVTTIDDCKYSF